MPPRDERLGPQPEPGWWAGRTRPDGGSWRDPGPTHHTTQAAARAHLDHIAIEPGDHAVIAYEQAASDDPEARILIEDVYLATSIGYDWVERRGPIRISYHPGGGFR